MTEQPNEPVERGAAEEASGVPVTPTEAEADRRPPSEAADAERPANEAADAERPANEEKELRP
ncbi:hypothetical protein AB0F81_15745 [Actinoplanes sp. NPDC024001]|uniref:hypothetical protein n=1 Tax=Actinoplanes sp. NPDC024001 TaxID=3154598 RepID=UPI0033CA97E4